MVNQYHQLRTEDMLSLSYDLMQSGTEKIFLR